MKVNNERSRCPTKRSLTPMLPPDLLRELTVIDEYTRECLAMLAQRHHRVRHHGAAAHRITGQASRAALKTGDGGAALGCD